MLQIPELLAPAGDLERLRYAINYGADAVYCALPEFGMRSAPTNFTPEQLSEGVIYAHARGRKVYLTMNTLPTNEEADRLPQAIKDAAAAGVDAFIVADLGVLDACKTFAPDIDVHMSTQTGITNWAAAPPNRTHTMGRRTPRLPPGCAAGGVGPGDDPAGHRHPPRQDPAGAGN